MGHRQLELAKRISIAGVVLLAAMSPARAAEVPVGTQVELLAKILSYDRNLESRVDGALRVMVLERVGSTSTGLDSQLEAMGKEMGYPVQISHVELQDAESLAKACDSGEPDIALVTDGLGQSVAMVASVLANRDVVSVSLDPDDVKSGIVIGFDLIESRPKILINLPQARKQNVDFSASLLTLAQVIR